MENLGSVKLIVLGDSSVGKSTMIVKFTEETFNANIGSTVGIEMYQKMVKIANQNVKVQIWDTAGQENYRSIAVNFYRRAHGIILAYDCTNRLTFEHVSIWMDQIRENARAEVCLILVATKLDKSEDKDVTAEEGQKLADNYSVPFFETSSKSGLNIQEAFSALTQQITDKGSDFFSDKGQSLLSANELQNQEGKKVKCC